MSTLKTATSALTAAVLVTSIGLAFAQTEDQPQQQPAEPTTAAVMPSEQTPADPNAAPADVNTMPADSTAAMQQPADDPAKVTPPVDSTAASSTTTTTDTTTTTTTTPSPSYDQPATPAPRADRH
ncbi:putative membrane protein [Pelomonas saccharophila]|uniref:Membrane protein n=1 Tax=Roseateles saccharophilus TaxID=304 RepID=A0ABU1YNV1_ROSSA|nr:hypothetical protein [Roseateles saccharophilus]MDR7270542.1 putative membrane protein [Roseateles saccharophilus]